MVIVGLMANGEIQSVPNSKKKYIEIKERRKVEINKSSIKGKKYVRIAFDADEYENCLDCIKSKLLKPPKPGEVDIGDKLYVVLQAEIAMKLARKLLEIRGK